MHCMLFWLVCTLIFSRAHTDRDHNNFIGSNQGANALLEWGRHGFHSARNSPAIDSKDDPAMSDEKEPSLAVRLQENTKATTATSTASHNATLAQIVVTVELNAQHNRRMAHLNKPSSESAASNHPVVAAAGRSRQTAVGTVTTPGRPLSLAPMDQEHILDDEQKEFIRLLNSTGANDSDNNTTLTNCTCISNVTQKWEKTKPITNCTCIILILVPPKKVYGTDALVVLITIIVVVLAVCIGSVAIAVTVHLSMRQKRHGSYHVPKCGLNETQVPRTPSTQQAQDVEGIPLIVIGNPQEPKEIPEVASISSLPDSRLLFVKSVSSEKDFNQQVKPGDLRFIDDSDLSSRSEHTNSIKC